MTQHTVGAAAPAAPREPAADATGLGVLRATITLMVVLHHALLAYHPFAPPPFDSLRTAPFWQAFPVVDPARWRGALWGVAYHDTFFMSLMFLIAGVFVWPSLARKGAGRFVVERTRRLGVPFVISAVMLAPLAYAPSYLQTGAAGGWAGFWSEWLALPSWPAGPAWFLWLLLAFSAITAAVVRVAPAWTQASARWLAARRPHALFGIVLAASALTYVPLAKAFGALDWTAVGPFTFQTSRVLHYAVYFAIGVAIGTAGSHRGVLATDGPLATRWLRWLVGAALAFGVAIVLAGRAFAAPGEPAVQRAAELGFVVACAALCFAYVAGFTRVSWPRSRVLDSLRANAYAIYVVHYVFVSWLQYLLLDVDLPGSVKATIVFAAAVALSWITAASLRAIGSCTLRACRRGARPRIGALDQPSA